jgi:hypothetical protein
MQVNNPYVRVPGFQLERWGGVVHAYAGGGLTPAHITRHERIKYGEPETGGEAFIPRKGDPNRSANILEVAAAWYGYGLVKMARGGLLSGYMGGSGGAGGGGTSSAQTIVDLRGAQIIGIDDLDRKIRTSVEKANRATATAMRKKATY